MRRVKVFFYSILAFIARRLHDRCWRAVFSHQWCEFLIIMVIIVKSLMHQRFADNPFLPPYDLRTIPPPDISTSLPTPPIPSITSSTASDTHVSHPSILSHTYCPSSHLHPPSPYPAPL